MASGILAHFVLPVGVEATPPDSTRAELYMRTLRRFQTDRLMCKLGNTLYVLWFKDHVDEFTQLRDLVRVETLTFPHIEDDGTCYMLPEEWLRAQLLKAQGAERL